jgi:hypothetical protein
MIPRSNPLRFLSVGENQAKSLQVRPRNVKQLRLRIEQACQAIRPIQLGNVLNNMRRRIERCIENSNI